MRAVISVLVSSLVFSSLAVHYETKLHHLSHSFVVNSPLSSGSQLFIANANKPQPNKPESPIPHRGSGRRELMGYFRVHSVV